jgi:hypothetical protein
MLIQMSRAVIYLPFHDTYLEIARKEWSQLNPTYVEKIGSGGRPLVYCI